MRLLRVGWFYEKDNSLQPPLAPVTGMLLLLRELATRKRSNSPDLQPKCRAHEDFCACLTSLDQRLELSYPNPPFCRLKYEKQHQRLPPIGDRFSGLLPHLCGGLGSTVFAAWLLVIFLLGTNSLGSSFLKIKIMFLESFVISFTRRH